MGRHDERPLRPEDGIQRGDDGYRPAGDPAQAAERGVHQHNHARLQAKRGQVPGQRLGRDRAISGIGDDVRFAHDRSPL